MRFPLEAGAIDEIPDDWAVKTPQAADNPGLAKLTPATKTADVKPSTDEAGNLSANDADGTLTFHAPAAPAEPTRSHPFQGDSERRHAVESGRGPGHEAASSSRDTRTVDTPGIRTSCARPRTRTEGGAAH